VCWVRRGTDGKFPHPESLQSPRTKRSISHEHQKTSRLSLISDRYRLPKEGEIVEVQYLYCHPGPDGKLIQAKYFGKVRDDIETAECGVSQLKVKANDSDSIEP
jgi:hypothetical protein